MALTFVKRPHNEVIFTNWRKEPSGFLVNNNVYLNGAPKFPFEGTYPLITSKFIGKMPLPQVFMENSDGTPLDFTTDYFGNSIDPNNVKH